MIHTTDVSPAAGAPVAYQYTQPFPLPDEVKTPSGGFSGTKARVYWLLRITRERSYSHRIGEQWGPPGWVPRFLLVEPWSGGAAGDRRMRQLREQGVEIEMQEFDPPGGRKSSTTLYRIVRDGLLDTPTKTSGARRTLHFDETVRLPLSGVTVRMLPVPCGTGFQSLISPAGSIEGIPGRPLDAALGSGSAIAPVSALNDEGYTEELRAAWRSGALVRSFDGSAEFVVVAEVDVDGWSVMPMLGRALGVLGADVIFLEGLG